MAMRVSAIGVVIGPREPILDVVPGQEKLVVEARIRPQDIDHVRKDARAEVRLVNAFDSRTALLLRSAGGVRPGRPREGAADSLESRPVATVELDPAEITRYSRLRLHAGMPAELYVTTPARTLVAYLAKAPGGLCESRHARAVMTHTLQDPFNHRKA